MDGDGRVQPTLRVMIVDDDAVHRAAVRAALEVDPGIEIVAEASTSDEAIAVAGPGIDVIVLDHLLDDGRTGADVAPELRAAAPDAHVVLFTAAELALHLDRPPGIDALVQKLHIDRLLPTVQVFRRYDRPAALTRNHADGSGPGR